MSYRVEEYLRPDGSSPYGRWFDGLPAPAAAKVVIGVARLAAGNTSNVRWFGGIGELRFDFGPGYRVYLLADGPGLIVLLGGGTKQRQQRDITRALQWRQEYRSRKRKE
ncbi:MAG: type II toxin-antitoxin system RelE/ParE family toxin [Gemmatimonadales bacterium]